MRFILITMILLTSHVLLGSDHIDGVPSLTKHEQVDLTDLYVFKNGQSKRNISILLNLYPGVGEEGHFSRKVQYNIILRPTVLLSPNMKAFETDSNNQATINCSFTDPGHHHSSNDASTVFCKVIKNGLIITKISSVVGDIKTNADEALKIFTGSRSDAFFITREHFDGVTQRKEFVSAKAENLMESINVLSIALEVDMKTLFPNNTDTLYAIAAESLTSEGGKLQILDRVGRPEITNLSLHAYNGAKKLKRNYNQTNAFEADNPSYDDFKNRLNTNISSYDGLDSMKNWNIENLNELTSLLLDDYLIFSTSENCINKNNNFLGIEKSILRGNTSQSCGGRKITDDIMNTLYSLYIGGLNADLTLFDSGTNRPYQSSSKVLSKDFPYLAKPQKDSLLNFKQHFLNKVIKAAQE